MKRFENQASRSHTSKDQIYNTIKEELEAENDSLMRERNKIEWQKNPQKPFNKKIANMGSEQSAYFEDESNNLSGISPIKNQESYNTGNTIKNKIKQIIQICNAESNNSYGADYKQIVEAEQQILTYLDNLNIHSESFIPNGENYSQNHSNPNKKSNLKIRKELSSKGMRNSIGDDAMEMIEEIERKALIQIESLRTDKIGLMRKLNEEVRAHNEEKRNRILLESHVAYLTQQLSRAGFQAANPMKFEELSKGEEIPQNLPHFSQKVPRQNTQGIEDFPNPQTNQNSQPYIQPQKSSPQVARNNQSSQHVNFQQNRPQTAVPLQSPQEQIQQEVYMLQDENKKMKRVLSQTSNPASTMNLKGQLRAELNELLRKVRNYQEILERGNSQGSTEIDSLLQQGNNLSQDGHRLMRIKSKPEFGSMRQENNFDREEIVREITFLRQKIAELENQNLSLSKNNNDRFTFVPKSPKIASTYTPKASSRRENANRFSPSKYEGLISQMKYATKI